MSRLTFSRCPSPAPGSPAARRSQLLDSLALGVLGLCLLGLAMAVTGADRSPAGDGPYTGCGIYEPVPGTPNTFREMTEVCESP